MNNKHISIFSGVLAVWMLFCAAELFAQDREPEASSIEFPGPVLEIALNRGMTHPITMADLGSGAEYQFVVDTGASVSVVDESIANALGFEVVGKSSVGAPGGNKVPVDIVLVPEIRIGKGVIRNAEFVTMDIDGMTRGLMQGVIGLPVFRDYLLTFDQSDDRIRISRSGLSSADNDVIPYRDSDGHIQIDVDVAGTTVVTHVDTGSMAAFTLPIEMMDELPVEKASFFGGGARLVGGDRRIERARLNGDIVFAGNRYENPRIGFMDPSPGYGNVGSRVLREYEMSVDQSAKLIRFRRNDQASESTDEPRRLGIEFRGVPGGAALTIARVESDSLGESAGLKAGDKLVAVNGTPIEQIQMQQLGQIIRGPGQLELRVERAGDIQVIHIP